MAGLIRGLLMGASIWLTNNFPSIVISVKILGFKFLSYIAETCNSALRTGMDDITGFFESLILSICWRYQRIQCRLHDPNILYSLPK